MYLKTIEDESIANVHCARGNQFIIKVTSEMFGEKRYKHNNSFRVNAYGTLMIRKELESTRAEDTNLQFDFTVTIVKGNEKLSGSYECEGTNISSVTFTDGTASFKLKGGQTLSIKNLPVGVDYEVEEVGANSIDFLTYADNQKGIISKNSEENFVRFKNVRNVLPETGRFGNIFIIGGAAFFMLFGFTILLLRRKVNYNGKSTCLLKKQ